MIAKLKWKVKQGVAFALIMSPWYRAFLRGATQKYMESPLYRNRMIEFGEDFAKEHFVTNLKHELPFWKWQVKKDKKMIARIIFTPFTVGTDLR